MFSQSFQTWNAEKSQHGQLKLTLMFKMIDTIHHSINMHRHKVIKFQQNIYTISIISALILLKIKLEKGSFSLIVFDVLFLIYLFSLPLFCHLYPNDKMSNIFAYFGVSKTFAYVNCSLKMSWFVIIRLHYIRQGNAFIWSDLDWNISEMLFSLHHFNIKDQIKDYGATV